MTKYFGDWASIDDVRNAFFGKYSNDEPPADFPTDDQILLAAYGGGAWEGYAYVLISRDGALTEVTASHCSCYGLEGQWDEGEVTWAALAMRPKMDRGYGFLSGLECPDAVDAFWALVEAHV
jgi:hypothetical protein